MVLQQHCHFRVFYVNPLVLFDFIPFIVVLPPRMSNTTSVLYLTHVYVCVPVSELYCLHILNS